MYRERLQCMLINEWQTGQQLNQAVQQQRHADFALVLAMCSPDVREFAEFYTPLPDAGPEKPDLYQQLGLQPQRDFGWNECDADRFAVQNTQLNQAGLAAWHLQNLLQPTAWVVQHDAKKLADEVANNLPVHCRRRLMGEHPLVQSADATGLYEVLQQLEQTGQAA